MDYSKINIKNIYIKRHIELAVVKIEGDMVTFRIAEQTHRGKDFTLNGEKFKSSCGYFLIVDTYPVFRDDYTGKILFVRGYDSAKDDNKITVSLHNFAGIMQAISEYNETNGMGCEKPWPQYADKYYYVGDNGEVILSACGIYPASDKKRILFGNTFRTREEAESARELVKKALKGVDENKLLREALKEAVEMYGKPGGPWNVPGDAGGWLDRARKVLEAENE